ncbi:MAG: hypothetical protein HZA31_12125 [Opitutae bacterium]|nr:hypothetical protein [Opitutae bacterium]
MLLTVALLCGCVAMRIEPLAVLQGQNQALVLHGNGSERKEGRTISVNGLPEILARATWVEKRVFHKGGVWLRFKENREIFLPHAFDFFLVRGVNGHFEIRKEDAARYRDVVQRIQKEANLSHPVEHQP